MNPKPHAELTKRLLEAESLEALPHPPELEELLEEPEALPHPPGLPSVPDETAELPHPPTLEPMPDEEEELPHPPGLEASEDIDVELPSEPDVEIPRREPQEGCWQYAFRRVLSSPRSRDGIYLARILLSLTGGGRWPYPLTPSLSQLSEEAFRLGVEMVYSFLDRGAKVTEHWWAAALAKRTEFSDYEEECAPIRDWLILLDRAANATIEKEEAALAEMRANET